MTRKRIILISNAKQWFFVPKKAKNLPYYSANFDKKKIIFVKNAIRVGTGPAGPDEKLNRPRRNRIFASSWYWNWQLYFKVFSDENIRTNSCTFVHNVEKILLTLYFLLRWTLIYYSQNRFSLLPSQTSYCLNLWFCRVLPDFCQFDVKNELAGFRPDWMEKIRPVPTLNAICSAYWRYHKQIYCNVEKSFAIRYFIVIV
jgi:hypothetical protein